jgi:alpha-L-arabinofuranosidase
VSIHSIGCIVLATATAWLATAAVPACAETPRIVVHANQPGHRISRYLTGACLEDVNHEVYGGIYSQMIFGESFQEPAPPSDEDEGPEVSGMWRIVRRGSARGTCGLDTREPCLGRQSQRITFLDGQGELGVANQGLNGWGMCLVQGKPYEGILWARAEKPAEIVLALENEDGTQRYASRRLSVKESGWQRLTFVLEPTVADQAGRFAVTLDRPGSVEMGYAFLQPGPWGRLGRPSAAPLPVRRDVAEALIDEGITVLRYGGSMVNNAEYRWKKMIGPRDRRPPYHGFWYPYSTNGWGILDFLDLCEAMGIPGIPALNIDESPADMGDFIEYVNGPADSPWGKKRAADGHPQPYGLRHIELGNEERIDENYFRKFAALAAAIWAKDRQITLVAGDFAYGHRLSDPWKFTGAVSKITSMAGQQKILQLAKQHGREVWFDVHVDTNGPRPDDSFAGMLSFVDMLDRIADGARHKVVVFEFNSNNHSQQRALANAMAIQAIERDGRIPIASAANCLQPDGQNDNDWNQGLLFLNPSQVWLQPPGYVTRMISRNYQPLFVPSEIEQAADSLDVSAKRSEDGKTLVLQVVNVGGQSCPATIQLEGFVPRQATAAVEELAGPLQASNASYNRNRIAPKSVRWRHNFADGQSRRVFPPYSFTVIRFQ